MRERADVQLVEIGAGLHRPRGGVRRKLLTAELDLAWYPALARRSAARARADVMHCPEPRGPLRRGEPPLVVTLHDLVPFHFPETMSRWSRVYARATHRPILQAADRIICNSTDTANDLIALLPDTGDRIRIIQLGVDAAFFDPPPSLAEQGEPYILFVGTQERRKNLARLESAVAILRSRGFQHTLVVAGEASDSVRLDKPFVRRLGSVP
ncbi:MAG: glycosyltransferase, partial [Gemmatimonadaceae bacterium]|nr:glycosyltransferase [Gemmatimonadaceae bacterium]